MNVLVCVCAQVIGGTIAYSPPFDNLMTFSFDDWSCGVILYAMLTCTLPFSTRVLEAKTNLILSVPESINDGVKYFPSPFPSFFFSFSLFLSLSLTHTFSFS
jgi:hypothetical protein